MKATVYIREMFQIIFFIMCIYTLVSSNDT